MLELVTPRECALSLDTALGDVLETIHALTNELECRPEYERLTDVARTLVMAQHKLRSLTSTATPSYRTICSLEGSPRR
jgi:hypothetical protein